MDSLVGKTALVTGGAKRIGAGVARALARAGANVVLHYQHSHDEADLLAREITALGQNAWTLSADLAQSSEVKALLPKAIDLAGPLDILINNASIFPTDTLMGFDEEALGASIQVNAMAPLILARAFAAQEHGGAIVNLLDARIVDYDATHVTYHLSKRMLYSMTRMLAVELAPTIQVNAVAPGLVLPPPGQDTEYLERLKGSNPLNRYGSLTGITDAVTFLVKSDFITGQVIYVDGGRHLRGSMYG